MNNLAFNSVFKSDNYSFIEVKVRLYNNKWRDCNTTMMTGDGRGESIIF